MKNQTFSSQDQKQLKQIGIKVSQAGEQFQSFKQGFPFVELIEPCTVKHGILKLSEAEEKAAEKAFLKEGQKKKILKFVPASGAASRMFQFLEKPQPEYADLKEKFLKGLRDFAFYGELAATLKKQGHDLERLRRQKKLEPILQALLDEQGLGYRQAPKGMILFHRDRNKSKTAFEEQLRESEIFADAKKRVAVHFTVPASFRAEVKQHLKSATAKLPRYHFDITESIQSPATDCLAIEKNGTPVRDTKGQLVLRPSGHGALLNNLNKLKAEIIYVKNIDNILPSKNRAEADRWKRILCGVFFKTQNDVFKAQKILAGRKMSPHEALEVLNLANRLGWKSPEKKGARQSLTYFFNRPLRVCGMVPNTGEPGGGPFWIKGKNGGISAQIIESAEVNFKSKAQEKIWRSSTHFNPVDFVCGVSDYRGSHYNLMKYTDAERGLISKKNYNGREIRVMELPGLWNGGMANWLSVFVEIPGSVFAPVKTVLDLLRKEHQIRG